MGETDGVPKDAKYLFRWVLAQWQSARQEARAYEVVGSIPVGFFLVLSFPTVNENQKCPQIRSLKGFTAANYKLNKVILPVKLGEKQAK